MYLPRLRARQGEVLAVRACAPAFSKGGNVVPILEPVTTLNENFVNRLDTIAASGLSCALVLNPSVGDYRHAGSWKVVGDFLSNEGLLGKHDLAVLSNADADHVKMAKWIAAERKNTPFQLDVVHEVDISTTLTGRTYGNVRWNIAEDRTVAANYSAPLGSKPVVWSHDPFVNLERNADYWPRQESVFSNRPATYRSAGYVGISDYLTIGKTYRTGGALPFAVVIHFTYNEAGSIRIRHFCSDTNHTQDDTAGKFSEAVDKLLAFVAAKGLPSNIAIDQFADLQSRQHYPGLGKVKEISMENHMLVMQAAV